MSVKAKKQFEMGEQGELRYANDGRVPHPEKPARSNPFRHCILALNASLRNWIGSISVPKDSIVLDFGCSVMQYRSLFPVSCEYWGADLPGNELASVVIRDDGSLDLPDNCIDVVLSTQVLEHVQNPALYVSEAYRVLKPGGHMILTTHGLFVYHPDPEDNWRWTSNGLRRQIQAAGFEVVGIEGLIGPAAAAVQFLQDTTWHRVPRPFRKVYVALFQTFVGLLDSRYTTTGRIRDAWVYSTLSKKPLK